jgi:hypothetical protein
MVPMPYPGGAGSSPVASGRATHAYGKPGTYTVKAIAGGSCGGGATAELTVRSRLQADLANATAFAGDDCQRRDCDPVIVDVSPTTFGPGIHVTLTGKDFGNLRGSFCSRPAERPGLSTSSPGPEAASSRPATSSPA